MSVIDEFGTVVGQGPPVLLLHAGGERRAVWDPVADAIAAAGGRAIAYDLPGHGDRGRVQPDRLDVFADELAATVGELDAAPMLVGASLGGSTALLALADRAVREHVAGLVLVDVVPDPAPERTRRWLAREVGPRAELPIVDDILGRGAALREIAAGLELPALLVRAGAGSPLRHDDVERFARTVPHARVAGVPEAGHLVARDAPGPLARLLAEQLWSPEVRRRRIERFLAETDAAAAEHPGGTLLGHLRRTAETLQAGGAEPWVVDTGHVHAAYGTDGFALRGRPTTRERLRGVVGARAEALVHDYGRCDRAASYPTFTTAEPALVDRHTGATTPLGDEQLRALVELTVANEQDVLAHSAEIRARHGDALEALFSAWRPLRRSRADAA